ncbi:MAG TPA: HEAT repeat domain-containing protein, partial [Planctomycetota bacterium]|nr:HEAT repeat domain-containing protein [Planctomycetota bacterium]
RPWVGLSLGVLAYRDKASKRPEKVKDLDGIVEDLVRSMKEERSPEFAAAFGLALGLAGDTRVREELTKKMLELSDEDARGYLSLGIGLLGCRDARDALHGQLREGVRKPLLLQQAAIGLGLLSDQTAVPELLEILKDAKTLSVQAAVATALSLIGDPRSVDSLLRIARDGRLNDCARGFAIVALGRIGDKEAIPWNSGIAWMANYRAFTRTLVGGGFAPGILDIL